MAILDFNKIWEVYRIPVKVHIAENAKRSDCAGMHIWKSLASQGDSHGSVYPNVSRTISSIVEYKRL